MVGKEGLQLIKTFISLEKGACKTVKGLFSTLGEMFKP